MGRTRQLLLWLGFCVVCATGSATLGYLAPAVPLSSGLRAVTGPLAVLVLPLASLLVPLFTVPRVPLRQRTVAWQLVVPVITGVVLAVVSGEAGNEVALQQRGRWTEAVVASKESGKSDHCTLRRASGQRISPDLTEGDGCQEYVEPGDTVSVRYDPAGAAAPVTAEESGSYGGFIAGLMVVQVAMGTWGCLRMYRQNAEQRARG
ncbi:hypothetical protein AB0I10_01895 [Streptomyces sp. NPDC050636]|uniref:hypothetical protein n=1 Tax=Streptomyces sp. NPDC050636 TaxID=3154510 RepID=UPI0034121DC0